MEAGENISSSFPFLNYRIGSKKLQTLSFFQSLPFHSAFQQKERCLVVPTVFLSFSPSLNLRFEAVHPYTLNGCRCSQHRAGTPWMSPKPPKAQTPCRTWPLVTAASLGFILCAMSKRCGEKGPALNLSCQPRVPCTSAVLYRAAPWFMWDITYWCLYRQQLSVSEESACYKKGSRCYLD